MDLGLYLNVLWRYRAIVAAGTLVALALAILSVARPSFVDGKPELTYRESALWESRSTLLVTQRGFPWGRAALPTATSEDQEDAETARGGTFADPMRFVGLATLYAQFAQSDAVEELVQPSETERVFAQPLIDFSTGSSVGTALPLITIGGIGETPARAKELAARATSVFRGYIRDQQNAAGIAAADRVVLQLVNEPTKPTLHTGRKITPAILAFLVVLMATIGLAFVLENLRTSKLRGATGEPPPGEKARPRESLGLEERPAAPEQATLRKVGSGPQ